MTTVYLAKIPEQIQGEIYCKERSLEIVSCQSDKVKKQKFYAWRLLELCAKKHGFNVEDLHFYKMQNGKWKCSEFEFSLSHSENFVAVILSSEKVGIDLQKDCELKTDLFASKILTKSELLEYSQLQDYNKREFLIEKWTQKESVYKMLEDKSLNISQINCKDYPITTKKISLEDETYYLSFSPLKKDVKIELFEI